jgi:hypothetical protein
VLDGAEAVGGLGVDAVSLYVRVLRLTWMFGLAGRVGCLADGPSPPEGLDGWEADSPIRVANGSVDGVRPPKARVGGNARLLVFLECDPIRHQPGAWLHDDAPRLQTAWHERQMARGRGGPLLLDVVRDRVLCKLDVAKEGGVVKGKDDVHGAVRPHLDTPFSNLVHYVLVMPTEELGNAAYGWPVHLALAGKGAVSGGALDWPAVKVAVGNAVPDDTPGPWLKLILPYDPGGYGRWLRSCPDRLRCLVCKGEPAGDLREVDAVQE